MAPRLLFPLLASAVAASAAVACEEDEYLVDTCRADPSFLADNEGALFLGASGGAVPVAVFGDLQCPYTKRMMVRLDEYADELRDRGEGDELQVFFRHAPRPDYPASRRAALAVAAAAVQGQEAAWRLLWLVILADDLDDDEIRRLAQTAGLDMVRFETDWGSDAAAAVVDEDFHRFLAFGFDAVPGVVICGETVSADADAVVDTLEHLVGQAE